MFVEAGRGTILLTRISFQGRDCGTVDYHGIAGLRVIERCAKDVKGADTWCARRVLSKVNDCTAVAQSGWRQDGTWQSLIFAVCHGIRVEAGCGFEP